jgi:hypothetical protein
VQLFANPGKVSRKSNLEVQRMEAQMQHNALLHQKAGNDRRRHMASLCRGTRRKAALNELLQGQVLALSALMDEQMPILDKSSHCNSAEKCVLPCQPLTFPNLSISEV